jgi:integrase/recombinase XerD
MTENLRESGVLNCMGNTVRRSAPSLYAAGGARKYLNAAERQRAFAAMQELPPDKALFALTLAWTGGRVSEVLALTAASFQVEMGIVAIVTLKRRRFVVREVPIPPDLMLGLDRHYRLAERQRSGAEAGQRLWPWSRVTAWALIKDVMRRAGISGKQACPRGLRHAFGVGTLQAGVPITKTREWLGHASLNTTAIYAALCGPEEIAVAKRFWQSTKIFSNKPDQLSKAGEGLSHRVTKGARPASG